MKCVLNGFINQLVVDLIGSVIVSFVALTVLTFVGLSTAAEALGMFPFMCLLVFLVSGTLGYYELLSREK